MYKLKYLRESELLTQKQIVEKIFCGQRAYSYYETGERDIPTQTLIRLADFYNVSVDYILGRTEPPQKEQVNRVLLFMRRKNHNIKHTPLKR